MPMPALNPVSTGSEMKSATKPSLRRPAATSMSPTSTASVAATTAACARLASGATSAIAAAVRMPIVVVVLTLRRRDEPTSAYAAIGRSAV